MVQVSNAAPAVQITITPAWCIALSVLIMALLLKPLFSPLIASASTQLAGRGWSTDATFLGKSAACDEESRDSGAGEAASSRRHHKNFERQVNTVLASETADCLQPMHCELEDYLYQHLKYCCPLDFPGLSILCAIFWAPDNGTSHFHETR